MIPKIIHYCWLSDDPIPDNLQKCMSSWQKVLPEYEFMKWDRNRFNINDCDWVREAYNNKKYAFAADYIRLFAVYNYGGIYLDMDIEVLKPFDKLLNNQYMLAYEKPSKNGIEAGCFGAEKNNPFIRACLETYNNKHFVKEDGTFELTPLPIIMKEVMTKGNYNFQLFNHDYFTAKSYDTGEITVTVNTYCIHHFAGSWKTKEEKEILEETQRIGRFLGYKIGRNIAEYHITFKYKKLKGIITLTGEKLRRLNK